MSRKYISPDGRLVGEDEACHGNVMRDGYRMGFDLMFMDSAGPGRIYHTDRQPAAINDAEVRSIVARERMIHDTRFAFLGDKAPAFDADRAEFLAKARTAGDANRHARDAARAAHYASAAITDRAEPDSARAQMIADLKGAGDREVSEAIRLARYG